jgi:hypothetical protein
MADAHPFHEPDNQLANCYLHFAAWLPAVRPSREMTGFEHKPARQERERIMPLTRSFAVLLFLMAGGAAIAADNALLIQVLPDGGYRVWHSDGVTHLSEDEIMAVAATATPEGGPLQPVEAGQARAIRTGQGVVIELPDAPTDRKLLIDRDDCGAIKVWHSEGETNLTNDQMTELVISALPGGGKLVRVDGRYAKAFDTPLGYSVVIWKPVKRRPSVGEPAPAAR